MKIMKKCMAFLVCISMVVSLLPYEISFAAVPKIRMINTFDSIQNAKNMGIADSNGNLFNMYGQGWWGKLRAPTYRAPGVLTNGLYSSGTRFPSTVANGGLLVSTLPLDSNNQLPWNGYWIPTGTSIPMMYFPTANDQYTNWNGAESLQFKIKFQPRTGSRLTMYDITIWSQGVPFTIPVANYNQIQVYSLNGTSIPLGTNYSTGGGGNYGEFYIDPKKTDISAELDAYIRIPLNLFKTNDLNGNPGIPLDLSKPIESFGASVSSSLAGWTVNLDIDDFGIIGQSFSSQTTMPEYTLDNYISGKIKPTTLETNKNYVKMINNFNDGETLRNAGTSDIVENLFNHVDGNTKVISAIYPNLFKFNTTKNNGKITVTRNDIAYDNVWQLQSPFIFSLNNPMNINDGNIIGANYMQMKITSNEFESQLFWPAVMQNGKIFEAPTTETTISISSNGSNWTAFQNYYTTIPSNFAGYVRVDLTKLTASDGSKLDFSSLISSTSFCIGNANSSTSQKINVTIDDFAFVGSGADFGGASGTYIDEVAYFSNLNSYVLKDSGTIVTNIQPGTKVSTFLSTLNPVGLVLKNSSGVDITNSVNDVIGTGTTIDIPSFNSARYTIVLYGDVDGNGLIDLSDLAAIKMHLLKSTTLQNEFFTAGDVFKKSNISISSLLAVKKQLLGISNISQS